MRGACAGHFRARRAISDHTPFPSPDGSINAAFAAELKEIVAGDQPLQAMLTQIAYLAKRLVPAAWETSVTFISPQGPVTVAATGPIAVELDDTQYATDGQGPCLDAARGRNVVLITDMQTENRWPVFVPVARAAQVGSLLSVPLPVPAPTMAAINISAQSVDAFDADSIEVATTIAEYAAIAVENTQRFIDHAELARQMAEAIMSRAAIEQAKGVLMSTQKCDADTAFEMLVRLSQQTHRKLHDVANAVIDQTTHD